MGTVCSVTLFEKEKNNVYNDIFSRILEIENLMSVNIETSDISRVNAAAGKTPVIVHEDVFNVISRALFFARLSGGAFDPSVGPLVSLWGINSENPRVPSLEEIETLLPLVNWEDVELRQNTREVFLKNYGMALDLGAIAKGYAVDEAASILKKAGIKRAIIDLGGDIYVLGKRKDGTPWRVGVQNPNGTRKDVMGISRVTNKAVVTSGVYERFFEADGKRYHHIFSPFEGYPAGGGLLSVTVIADDSINADALSTAVFVLGYEEGMKLLKSFPGAQAVFIFDDNSVTLTPGADFTLTDKTFNIKY